MDRAKITIKGERVQDIGYRVSLLTNALGFGISKFYAYNTKIIDKQAVIALVEAENETIDDFYNYIRENVPEDATISDFEMEDFMGNVMDIDRYLHFIQIEQLNKGIPAILEIRDNTKKMLEKQDSMLEKQDSMLEKQDSMLEKQDTTIQILRNVSEELRSVHEDTSDMKSTLSRIEVDVKDTKFSLSSFIEEKFRKQEKEIAEIKATLAGMQGAG